MLWEDHVPEEEWQGRIFQYGQFSPKEAMDLFPDQSSDKLPDQPEDSSHF